MELSPGPDYRCYLHLFSETRHFWIKSAPLHGRFLTFPMGLSRILIFYTVSYGTIAETCSLALPPFKFGKPPLTRLSAISIINTVSYGPIAGTWLPDIHLTTIFENFCPPSRTFFDVSYGTIGDTYQLHCFLWDYSRCWLPGIPPFTSVFLVFNWPTTYNLTLKFINLSINNISQL
jgi:hypothetical protein